MRALTVDVSALLVDRAREYSLDLGESIYASGRLTALMFKLYKEFVISDEASPLAIEGLVLEMLAEVSRRKPGRDSRTPPRWMILVIDFLEDRYRERITLEEVASAAGVHPVHLARQFRRYKRCTIGEYIRRLRIERACRELSTSNGSLSAIAAGVGFADQSHFSRTFKHVVGLTPAEYRANLPMLV